MMYSSRFLLVCLMLLAAMLATNIVLGKEPVPEVTAKPETKSNPKDQAVMVWVPAGPFVMGVDKAAPDSEGRPQVNAPKHEVTLDGYWIYQTPVTVKQYRAYCDATGKKMPTPPLWGWKDDHPMVNINWQEAKQYADWAGAALPTEAQWEKAARGTDGRLYPWGNTWDAKQCVHSNKVWGDKNSTQPVGTCLKNASPYGALDMAGNVWEMCADWFGNDYYSTSPKENPTGSPWWVETPGGKVWATYKVVRGGAWCLCDPKDFQSVNRDWGVTIETAELDLGFRCVVAGK